MRIYETGIICAAVFLALAAAASAVQIGPGQSYNCTAGGEIVSCTICDYGNQTCECNETTDCGTCTIDKELRPGEFYEKQEGVCDVEIAVEECEEEGTEIRPRSYLMDMSIDKHEGSEIDLGIEIRDMFGAVIESKHYAPFSETDVMSAKYRYNFTCPTKVLVDTVDQQSCFRFLDEYIGENDPMSYILAKDMEKYREDLVGCQGDLNAEKSRSRDYKDGWDNCNMDMKLVNDEIVRMNDTLTQERREMQREVAGIRATTVDAGYFGWAVLEGLAIICLLLWILVGKDL